MFADLFQAYELLAAKADSAFRKVKKDYGPCIKCEIGCSDCCYAVFGLFLIESVYLKYHFDQLDRGLRRGALLRSNKSDRDLLRIEKSLQPGNSARTRAWSMENERVRCPLLGGDQKCLLYPFRPITCRVYGIPTVSGGKVHVCWKAGFEKDKSYPAFNLDGIYRELYWLSRKLLGRAGQRNMERASLLLSVSKSIKTPIEDLIKGI